MKKIITILSTFLIITLLFTGSCYARAGGGSGSGSSGGGGSSSSGGNSYHNHYYGRRGRSNPIEGIVMTVVVVSGIYGLNASQRRRKARLLHQRTKKQLDILDDEDAFWNEERIKKEVKRNYFIIQEAWSKKDLETLKDYLTPQLLDAWQTKMNWYEFQGRRNELTNIKLIKQHIVNVYDSENDDEDYFWVYIEGMMDDLTIDEQNQVIESYDGVFVEYWKFKRLGNRILLDEIRQQDEYEN